jgi:hypothetical protein
MVNHVFYYDDPMVADGGWRPMHLIPSMMVLFQALGNSCRVGQINMRICGHTSIYTG